MWIVTVVAVAIAVVAILMTVVIAVMIIILITMILMLTSSNLKALIVRIIILTSILDAQIAL